MYCKNCGKQSEDELCDACKAKIEGKEGETAKNGSSACNCEQPNLVSETVDLQSYENYGKKGAISSFICGIVGFLVSYAAVFFGAFYIQTVIEMNKGHLDSSQKSVIESLVSIGKSGFTIVLAVCIAMAAISLIYGIISIVRFTKMRSAAKKPIKTLVFGIIGCALTVMAIVVCLMAFGYFSGQIPIPTV